MCLSLTELVSSESSQCLCFAGIDEISVDVYKGVEHSDSEDSDKSDSSDSEYASDEEQRAKDGQDETLNEEAKKDSAKSRVKDQPPVSQDKETKADTLVASESAATDTSATISDASAKDKPSTDSDIDGPDKTKKSPASPGPRETVQAKEDTKQQAPVDDSDSERELVIDLGEEQGGKDRKRSRKDSTTVKESATKPEGKMCVILFFLLIYFSNNPTGNKPTLITAFL